MQLLRFRVTNFRSVSDSGWIEVDDITTLIGTNESGKTNLLLPLWKLNPADGGEIDLQADLPREKYHVYRSAEDKPTFITAIYELNDGEKAALENVTGTTGVSIIEVSKDFNGELKFAFPEIGTGIPSVSIDDVIVYLEESANTIKSTTQSSKKEEERKSNILDMIEVASERAAKCTSVADSLSSALAVLKGKTFDVQNSQSLSSLTELIEILEEKQESLKQKPIASRKEVIEHLRTSMPKYVYYSNYGNLDSQIYLPHVVDNLNRSGLGEKETARARTLKTLFKYVNLDPQEIRQMGDENTNSQSEQEIARIAKQKSEREILLSSAASGFTKAFNEWWKQGNYTFEFTADGNYFRIWVSDSIRPEKIQLEARSAGLQWFFSFYLVFLVESEQHHRNAILLLDEPGVTLHPNAQKDLFQFFESLAEKNQMIYTTHSPFMVDSDHLERVRSVFIDRQGKTVCSPDLRASEKEQGKNQSQSIYPAHAALGLTVSSMLLDNCIPVLVEGESDQLYLSALKNLMISKGKISPLKDIVFIPTGGVKGIKATTGIISGRRDEHPFVIVDGDVPGQNIKKELEKDFYADCTSRIIDISTFTNVDKGEIEDIFPREKLKSVINQFLPRPEDAEDEFVDVANDKDPICNQVESFAKEQGIVLERGWKVKLAGKVKKEILRGKGMIIDEQDDEFETLVRLFTTITN